MKPELIQIAKEPMQSFHAIQNIKPNVNNRWHYHPEIELVYFNRGSGMQFVGDSIKRFKAGDIVLVGPNLPHCWKFETESTHIQDVSPYSTVIHFLEDFWGKTFLNLPENKFIKNAIDRSKNGLLISAEKEPLVAKLMEQILDAAGPARVTLLMDTLAMMGISVSAKQLSSNGFKRNSHAETDKYRINVIYDYSFANFKENITIDEIARVANLAPGSFCRYFKSKTNKTYMQFLNEIRVSHACKLLIEDKDLNIKQICYEAGFNNFSSFHSIFKSITGRTPLIYKQDFIQSD